MVLGFGGRESDKDKIKAAAIISWFFWVQGSCVTADS
jgi:hypothetical protein